MQRKTVTNRFNWLIIISLLSFGLILSVAITMYMLYNFNKDQLEKDQLHLKGLATSVKRFVENAYSLNYH